MKLRRNLFEILNARNLSLEEMVNTFVTTRAFWSLFTAKNQIILGARGSGKTALVKMVSHNHLSRLKSPKAHEIIRSKAFIGIYLPTNIEWVSGLKNKPWQSEEEKENEFQWRLNVSSCLSFINTARSCLDNYVEDRVEKALIEEDICKDLTSHWLDSDKEYNTFTKLQISLIDLQDHKKIQVSRLRINGKLRENEEHVGVAFHTDLFSPIRRGINLISKALNFPQETLWFICLDEAEFLEPMHHRILNSHMRSDSGNVLFKITTTPYVHHTLDTNTGSPVEEGHDFEYVYIDKDPILKGMERDVGTYNFASKVFKKRDESSLKIFKDISLNKLLGPSLMLEKKRSFWEIDSHEFKLLQKYSSETTIERAKRLLSDKIRFSDQISRKIHGALLLREAVENLKGQRNLDIYSGDLMAVRCSDGNPRRLIRIFNSYLSKIRWNKLRKRDEYYSIPPEEQTKILNAFSSSILLRTKSETKVGRKLFSFINKIGLYMKDRLYNYPLSTNQVTSINIDDKVSDEDWNLIKRAVDLGLLYPNINFNHPDKLPVREGKFHLAYVLSPHFKLLPRRGRDVALATVLEYNEKDKKRDSNETQLTEQIRFKLD